MVDDFDASRLALTAQIAEARNRGEEAALPTLYGHLGLTEVWAGRFEQARQAIDEAWRLREYVPAVPLSLSSADGLLAALTGHTDTARAKVAELLEGAVYRRADEFFYRHIKGLAALLDGDHEEAVAELTAAYAAARETGQHEPGRRNRPEGDLAQALVDVGRVTEAAAVGAEVLALGRGTRHQNGGLNDAHLGGRHGATLTATERRIAEMVAGGMTNREVASRLFASVRTVETHLTAIYRKLEIRSRSELAARYGSRPGGARSVAMDEQKGT